MILRPLSGLSTEPYLLADICGHLVVAGGIISALLLTELANRLLGPFPWLVFLLVFFGVILSMAVWVKKTRAAAFLDRFLERANSLLPTPGLLQQGYIWIEKRSAFLHLWFYGALLLYIFFQPLFHRISDKGGASDVEAGPFAEFLIALSSVFLVLLALLLFACLAAGYLNRRAEHR